MDYTLPKDFNGILFAIFRVTDQKLWFFKDLNKIWFLKSILISVCFRDWHVAWSDRPVPVRVDLHWEPLDLMKSGRTRSVDTGSLKWTILGD
jgi:hypothetical protein